MASGRAIAEAFLAAARAELSALKPGNVHVFASGHGMETGQFEAAAIAAAPLVADPALKVGTRILRAVEASWAAAGCNTNLGILLLCAPLARAAETAGRGPSRDLRSALARVLAELDADDARDVFRAISTANPGGLGRAAVQDVSAPPTVTLREAMAMAAGRDRIARAYVTDDEDIFVHALPWLRQARVAAATEALAVTTLHMRLLAAFPDSHIARKHGAGTAEAVCREAAVLTARILPAAGPEDIPALLAFDRSLKARGLNPGTTADFVVATLFASRLEAENSDTAQA